MNGRTAEEFPDSVKEIVRRGHEAAGHCYNTEDLWSLPKDEEKRVVDKSLSTLERVSGVYPVGWLSQQGAYEQKHTKAFMRRKVALAQ